MFFHEYFADFDGDFGVFDENDTYNFVPNKHPPFSLSFQAPGALKGANTAVFTVYSVKTISSQYCFFRENTSHFKKPEDQWSCKRSPDILA